MIYLTDYHIDINVTREVENDLGWFFKGDMNHKSLPEMIQYFNNSPVAINAYELMALKKFMDDYAAQNGHHTFVMSNEPLTITDMIKSLNVSPSLNQLFNRDNDAITPFSSLYDHYTTSTESPKSKIAFSKDLKRWHPLIKRTQVLINGTATAAWKGVSLVTGSIL